MIDKAKKPLGKNAYGSIPHLPGSKTGPADRTITQGQADIIFKKRRDEHDKIYAQLKLDGSCVSVAKIEGEIVALTRAGYTAISSPHDMHHVFNDWVEQNKHKFSFLQDGERLCGEWLHQSHGIKYTITKSPFVAFDLFKSSGERLNVFSCKEICDFYQFDYSPTVDMTVGNKSIDEIMRRLVFTVRGQSYLCENNKHEGIIFRVERKGRHDYICKHVMQYFEPGKYLKGEPIFNDFLI